MKRRGQVLMQALVLIGVILAVGVGMMTYIDAAHRRARNEKWGAIADEAARTGLAMMLGWGRANVDKYRTTPQEWDNPDGTVIDALRGYVNSPFFSTNLPHGFTAPADAGTDFGVDHVPGVGSIIRPAAFAGAPTVGAGGDLGEYVVGVYGNYVATFKARLQTFEVSDHTARMYKIGVAGRVRQLGKTGGEARLVADRVQMATVGRVPLSRYAALVDIDLTTNWVPGEIVEGPVHINRGYVDEPLGVAPAGVSATSGRSFMRLRVPGGFELPAGAANHPIFTDAVTMTRSSARAYPDDTTLSSNLFAVNRAGGTSDETIGGASFTDALSRDIFTAPENQALTSGKATPEWVEDPVSLPVNSRGRLASALKAEVPLQNLQWLQQLDDGVYVPDQGMMANTATGAQYTANTGVVAGGIYVRGTVEIMRMAVDGDYSFYAFQMGSQTADANHRCYLVAADRRAHKLRLMAYPQGQTLRQLLTTAGTFKALADLGHPYSTTDPAAYAASATGTVGVNLLGANGFPFNGVIFVDYAANDPVRTDAGAAKIYLPPSGTAHVPLTGNILSLGDPGDPVTGNRAAKQVGAPALPWQTPALAAAEVVSTEDPGVAGMLKPCTRLNIIASGNVFIQNHILLDGVMKQVDTSDLVGKLRRDNVRLQSSHDLIGIVADKQVMVGLCAPDTTDRPKLGVVVTAAIAALGDPAFDYATNHVQAIPAGGLGNRDYDMFALNGSFGVESIAHVLSGETLPENYGIGVPDGAHGFKPYVSSAGGTYPTNPLYDRNGGSAQWGFPALMNDLANPNVLASRGRLVLFGSLVLKKRGAVGLGNRSYDKDYRYDQRLLTVSPPLFPNSVNLVTFISKIGAAGMPPYSGADRDELAILN